VSYEYHPTGETAIVIVPPPDIMGYADHYRSLYMPDTMHHMEPHITVLHPFVPYEQLPQAEPRLRSVLASLPARRLSIRGFAVFRQTGVLYLYLADPERVISIYQAIHTEFPEYAAYGGLHGDTFVPHMTVGHFEEPDDLEKVYSELATQRLYIGFEVERVTIKYKLSDEIWDTWAELPLGSPGENC
jgi:2'-5' RNA ligase